MRANESLQASPENLDRGSKPDAGIGLVEDGVDVLHESVAHNPGIVWHTAGSHNRANAGRAAAVGGTQADIIGRDGELASIESKEDTRRARARESVVPARTTNRSAASLAANLGPEGRDARGGADDEGGTRVDDHSACVGSGAPGARRTGGEPVGLGGERGVGNGARVLGSIRSTEVKLRAGGGEAEAEGWA